MADSPNQKTSSSKVRISLATFMLMIGLATAVFLIWHLAIKRDRMQEAVYDLQIQSRRLRVDDKSKIAVIYREQLRYNDQIFDLYIPEGPSFELCIKLEGVAISADYSNPVSRRLLPIGKHVIEVVDERQSPNVVVLIDGTQVIDIEKSKFANLATGISTVAIFDSCTSFAPEETVHLFERTYHYQLDMAKSSQIATRLSKAECDMLNAKQLGVFVWIQAAE